MIEYGMIQLYQGGIKLRQKWIVALAFGALILLLAACGSKNDQSASTVSAEPQTAEHEIVIKATNWAFDKPEYIVPKDTPVKIILELEGGHGIKVEGTDINLGPGNPSTIVTLKEGVYEFECSIMCGVGHKDMVSKLVVQ